MHYNAVTVKQTCQSNPSVKPFYCEVGVTMVTIWIALESSEVGVDNGEYLNGIGKFYLQ